MSLKLRLTLWYVLIMLIISAIALAAITSFSRYMVLRDAQDRLMKAVSGMEMQLCAPKRDNKPGGPPRRFYDNGVHTIILDEDKNVIEGNIPFSITDELDINDGTVRKESYDGNSFLVYDKKVETANGNVYIKGFVSIDEGNLAVKSILRNNILLTALLILLAALGGYFITSRALKPVDIMSKTANSIIKSKDLSQRINIGKSNDELSSLAATLDEMLSGIEGAFQREKQFTSDASHELRTPIAVILSECEYMTDCADTVDELKDSAESVKEEAQKMSRLVSELLSIARMDKDSLKLNFEETDISELVSFVCDEQEEINTDEIKLIREIKPGILAEADKFLLARLFINLISNAYKYNKENGEIKVSLSENDGDVIFAVSDTGIGIAEENLPKIWERLYQVDPARSDNENGGMGLGLSMVKWIAEKHSGKAEVQSELGKGTTFTFTFPARR
ncbi:MAG: HAMP domain-containing histidine kinase [Clostridia bacterium]|nr:HAMP domain-containing histidine kinase [Clostridia bacterium]